MCGLIGKKNKYTLKADEFDKKDFDIDNILVLDQEQFNAFICGMTYDMSIGKKGVYSSGRLKIKHPSSWLHDDTIQQYYEEFKDRLDNTFTTCNGREINSPTGYEYFIEHIGTINPAKENRIIGSYYSKAYKISKVQEVKN